MWANFASLRCTGRPSRARLDAGPSGWRSRVRAAGREGGRAGMGGWVGVSGSLAVASEDKQSTAAAAARRRARSLSHRAYIPPSLLPLSLPPSSLVLLAAGCRSRCGCASRTGSASASCSTSATARRPSHARTRPRALLGQRGGGGYLAVGACSSRAAEPRELQIEDRGWGDRCMDGPIQSPGN